MIIVAFVVVVVAVVVVVVNAIFALFDYEQCDLRKF